MPTPPSANPDPAPAYTGGKITNRQILAGLKYSPIGGGKATPGNLHVTKEDADYVVRTASELAARATERGKVVFVPSDISIDISAVTIDLWATVASDRGQHGSEGALIYSNAKGLKSHAWNGGDANGHIQLRGNGRLTGLRLRGWAYNYWNNPEHPGYIPFAPGETRRERERWRESRYARGINVHSSTVQIDNCEIYGWSYCAINIGSAATSYSPTILYSHFHDNMLTSAGYAAEVIRGHPTFRYCYFNAHRHAVAGFGYADGGFIIEDCVFGPSVSSFQIDMHGLHNNLSEDRTVSDPKSPLYHGRAGGDMIVRRTTHLYTNVIADANFDAGKPCSAISIRGVPGGTGVLVERSAFAHHSQDSNISGAGRAIPNPNPCHQQTRKTGKQGFSCSTAANGFSSNFRMRENAYGIFKSSPPPGIGAPIDFRNPPSSADLPLDTVGTFPSEVTNPWAQDPDPERRIAVARGGRQLVNSLEDIAETIAATDNDDKT